MKERLFALVTAVLVLSQCGLVTTGAATEYHKETAYARADVTLYMVNYTNGNHLSYRNNTEEKLLRLATGAALISSSVDFTLDYNGWNLTEDLNFTTGGTAMFTIWLQGSRDARGLRLGAEVRAENGNRSCGRSDTIVSLGTGPAPFEVTVPLTSYQLMAEENLRATVYIDYLGLPLTVDMLTGGDRSRTVLPVENYVKLTMDLEVNVTKMAVTFQADAEGPFSAAFYGRMEVHDYNLTGPTEPKTILRASMADLLGIWSYGKDNAKKGKYVFEASYDVTSGQQLKDQITFEITKTTDEISSSTIWFVVALLVIIVALVLCIALIRRRRRAG